MPRVIIPAQLRDLTTDEADIDVADATVREFVAALTDATPGCIESHRGARSCSDRQAQEKVRQ
jgi:hypothetical protein